MSPRISVFLPSYNKGGFAVEAARSVLGQDFTDFELWIMENSTDDGRTRKLLRKFADLSDPRVIYEEIDLPAAVRNRHAPCPYLLNQYYPLANGELILYVSDDDLFMPGIFREVVSHFDDNPEHDAAYFHLARTSAYSPGEGKSWRQRWAGIAADVPRTAGQVDCFIDGGQVAYRKRVLEVMGQPYFYDGLGPEANHCDGIHLNDIGLAGFTFYPIDAQGVIHRHTPVSTWTKGF